MSDHGAAAAVGQPHFSATERAALQAEDRHAGKIVIGLMVSIFSTGLILYIGVLTFCALWPHVTNF